MCPLKKNFFNDYLWVLNAVPHDFFPVLINGFEKSSFIRNLLHDVLGGKDGLQVKPLDLHLQPFVYGLLDTKQTLLPNLRLRNNQINPCGKK